MRTFLCAAALAMAFSGAALAPSVWAPSAWAMGNSNDPPAGATPTDYSRAKAMIEAKKYGEAIPLLQQVVAKEPKNADAYNLLGFATRKSGNPQASLQYYTQALQIDSKHLGANEYIGEAYLMLDQPQQAEQHLARLDQLCVFGCAEHRELKTAIANYKAGKKPTN